MNRQELVKGISEIAGLTKIDVERVVRGPTDDRLASLNSWDTKGDARLPEQPACLSGAPMKPGDRIYVQGSVSIDHGETDVAGGWATILHIEARPGYTGVLVIQHPHRVYNLDYLLPNQEKWAKEYGDQEAHPDPDMRPHLNPTQEEVAEGYAQEYLIDVIRLSRSKKPYKHLLPALKYWAVKAEKANGAISDLVRALGG